MGRYPANYLIGHFPLPRRLAPFSAGILLPAISSGITPSFPGLFRISGYVRNVLLALPPLGHLAITSFDLHVLAMPPAFNLSQDQTLHLKVLSFNKKSDSNAHRWTLGHSGLASIKDASTRVPTQITCQIFNEHPRPAKGLGERVGEYSPAASPVNFHPTRVADHPENPATARS